MPGHKPSIVPVDNQASIIAALQYQTPLSRKYHLFPLRYPLVVVITFRFEEL